MKKSPNKKLQQVSCSQISNPKHQQPSSNNITIQNFQIKPQVNQPMCQGCRNLAKIIDNKKNQQELKQQQDKIMEQLKGIHKSDDIILDFSQFFFWMMAGWFMNLTLLLNNNSQCLLDEGFNLYTWHYVDFVVTIILMISLIITGPIVASKSKCCSVIVGVIWFLGMVTKIIWFIVGFILLFMVSFERCNQRVILYTSTSFMFYIPFAIYLIIKSIDVHNRINKQMDKLDKIVSKLNLPENHDFIQRYNRSKPLIKSAFQQNAYKSDNIYTIKIALDIIDTIYKQIRVWAFAGWIVSFTLAGKDHDTALTLCMSVTYGKNMLVSLKTWLWVDGASTLFLAVCFVILAYLLNKRHQHEIDYEAHPFLWRLLKEKDLFGVNFILVMASIISIIFKICWLIVGIIIYLKYVTLDNCRDYTVDYLMLYFTWSIYIMAFLFSVIFTYLFYKCCYIQH